MNLPEIPYKSANKKSYQTKFGGYNHTLGASDGEIYDMTNMTSDNYPVLSPRQQRYTLRTLTKPHGIFNHGDKMMWVDGTSFYYDGTVYGTVADSDKQFATVNNKIIIFPDKKYFNLDTLKSKGTYATIAALESTVLTPTINDIYLVGSTAPYKLYYWNGDEWVQNKYTFGDLEQSLTANNVVFLAKGELYEASAENNTIYSPTLNWEDYFSVGDAVKISGCTVHKENNKTPIIREINGHHLRFYENVFTLDTIPTNYITEDYQFKYGDANMAWFMITDTQYILCDLGDITSDYYITRSSGSFAWRYIKNNCKLYYENSKAYVENEWGSKVELSTSNVSQRVKANTYLSGQYYSEKVTIGNLDYIMLETSKSLLGTFQLCTHYNYGSTEEAQGFVDYDIRNKEGILSTITQYGPSGVETILAANFTSTDGTVDVDLVWKSLLLYEGNFNATEVPKNTAETSITLKRELPDMDYICSDNNRLWGCKDDTIYTSKLGDPFNFNVFDGLATDSWSVNAGTAGKFTGCIGYLGYPTFFKEDMIYKVYGSTPRNYEGVPTMTLGLSSNGSLAIAGETLFYMNKEGIVAYTGGMPRLISESLGARYTGGAAGSDGMKYYISMKDTSGAYSLFVYDTLNGLWHKEDSLQALSFCYTDQLNVLTSDGKIKTVSPCSKPTGSTEEGNVPWMVQFAEFYADSPNKKGVSKVHLRLHLEQSANATAYIKYNGDANWTTIKEMRGTYKQSYYLPIRPRRGDSFSIKLEGAGKCDIYSLSLEYYTGSQL